MQERLYQAVWIVMLAVVLWPWLALAEDPAPSGMDWSEVLLMLVKQVLPIVLAMVAPYVTKGFVLLLGSTGKWGAVISAAIGVIVSGAAAAGMGQSPDMSSAIATFGGVTGATAHGVMQSKPIEGGAMKSIALFLIVPFLFAGCYHNPRTWVERDGHMARQYHVSGHGWTEQGIITPSECDWVDLSKSPIDQMEYCPPKHRGTETTGMHVAQSTFDTVIPAAIHGLAFIAAFGVGAALMPATQISQSVTGTTVNGSPIRTSTLLINGPVPGGVAR